MCVFAANHQWIAESAYTSLWQAAQADPLSEVRSTKPTTLIILRRLNSLCAAVPARSLTRRQFGMLDEGPDHDEVKLVGVAGIREKHVQRGEVEGIAAAGGSIDSDHDPSGRHVICFSVICLRSRFVLLVSMVKMRALWRSRSAQNFSNF